MTLHLLSEESQEGALLVELLPLRLVDFGEVLVAPGVDDVLLHDNELVSQRRVHVHDHEAVLEVDEQTLMVFGGEALFAHIRGSKMLTGLQVVLEQLFLDLTEQECRVEAGVQLFIGAES